MAGTPKKQVMLTLDVETELMLEELLAAVRKNGPYVSASAFLRYLIQKYHLENRAPKGDEAHHDNISGDLHA